MSVSAPLLTITIEPDHSVRIYPGEDFDPEVHVDLMVEVVGAVVSA